MKIIQCQQGDDYWQELHRGRVTAGRMDRVITPKTGKLSSSYKGLICELIAEKTAGSPVGQAWMTRPMEHGLETEHEARRWYEMEFNVDVRQVGFCLTDDERFGCSPDGLLMEKSDESIHMRGGLEIKCPLLTTHAAYVLGYASLVDDYKPQVHGNMLVTEAMWWDVISYCPPLEPVRIRVERDEYTEALAKCLEVFWADYLWAQERFGLVEATTILRLAIEETSDAQGTVQV